MSLTTEHSGNLLLHSRKLVKRYRKRTVVNEVSVQVEQGEIVGLLGPNGAGKTTTFYMFVGLVTPNGGEIFLQDRNITRLPMYQRARLGIGYLSQEASGFRYLTVRENLDRKSTRLNSSHVASSYAVFCLQK